MEIIHPGNAPRKTYVGTCRACGCKVRANGCEVAWVMPGDPHPSREAVPSVRCPNECGPIYLTEEGRKG